MALSYLRAGDYVRAQKQCAEIALADPSHADSHNLLGVIAIHDGQFEVAIACFQRALALGLQQAYVHNNLGAAHQALGELEEASACFHRALDATPDSVEINYNLGIVQLLLQRPHEAAQCFRETLRLMPQHAQAHFNLGYLDQQEGRLDEAAAHYRQALEAQPNYFQARNNLGGLLVDRQEFDEGMMHCQLALALNPHDAKAHNNMGAALTSLGRHQEALTHFSQALKLDPSHPEANWNSSQLLLLFGDFEKGWPAYEWRRTQPKISPRSSSQPLWDGSMRMDSTILLHAEQGLGDTLQFIRYAALVKERVGRVIVDCQTALMGLLSLIPEIDYIVPADSILPDFDIQSPLLSLPWIFHTTQETIPAAIPYLQAKPELVDYWHQELKSIKGLKIGIAWQGGKFDPRRTVPLEQFAKLAAVKGVHLISLQKGAGSEQLARLAGQFPVVDFGDRLDTASGPFMDSAAIMKNLDLVVSSDNVIVHLAGGLGVPVWLALPFVPEWRWQLNREDSPWYPSMRLFRQTRMGQWDDVFTRIAEELPAFDARSAKASQTGGTS